MNEKNDSVEKYFLKYAFPCTYVLVLQGKISKEKQEELEKKLFTGEKISRDELEKTFEAAFRRIKKLANEMKKDYWDRKIIEEYFLRQHNKCIEDGDGSYKDLPETFKNLCKVREVKVISKEKEFLTVQYERKEKKVIGTMVPDIKAGDKIRIHLGYAIEKIE